MSKALSPRRRRNESFISRSVDEGQLADNDDSERLDKLLERLEPAPKSRRFFRKAAAVKKKISQMIISFENQSQTATLKEISLMENTKVKQDCLDMIKRTMKLTKFSQILFQKPFGNVWMWILFDFGF